MKGEVRDLFRGAWVVARREIQDQFRDWRILSPILLLTLFFPLLMNFTAQQAMSFVSRYGAPIVGDRLIPFLFMVVGFFPISISLVIALETFAGERERLSLEPLLSTPLSDSQLYLGKGLASLILPLSAAYLGIGVYLVGLHFRVGWSAPFVLLIQVILLTTVQAVLMVSGAVIISSQATSVRAANLLASFIILPVSQLIIGESLIMFWGRYEILWLVMLGQVIIIGLLVRMGLKLFNREALLGREFDVLNLKRAARYFTNKFLRDARGLRDWYRSLITESLPDLKAAIVFTLILFAAAYGLGLILANRFTFPEGRVALDHMNGNLPAQFGSFGLFSAHGWAWIVLQNLRALGMATLLGVFSFGVIAELLLMAPITLIGFLAGNIGYLGIAPLKMLAALVLPHAVAEIPASLLAGSAILKLGMAVMSPPEGLSLGESWITAFAEWVRISVGLVIPLLILAGFLEAFLTPYIALLILN
jgi:ABC-type transport system involved in multi-copper enzyme maturation permease subunit